MPGQERVLKQRKVLNSVLSQLVEISQIIEPVLSGERHTNGLAYRALDPKGRGFIIHCKEGGFDAQYVDETGQKYVLKVFPPKK